MPRGPVSYESRQVLRLETFIEDGIIVFTRHWFMGSVITSVLCPMVTSL